MKFDSYLIHIATRATETKREKVETHQTKSRQLQHRITEENGNSNKRDMPVMIMEKWITGFASFEGVTVYQEFSCHICGGIYGYYFCCDILLTSMRNMSHVLLQVTE